jgi:PAS domain S-box-containing protein
MEITLAQAVAVAGVLATLSGAAIAVWRARADLAKLRRDAGADSAVEIDRERQRRRDAHVAEDTAISALEVKSMELEAALETIHGLQRDLGWYASEYPLLKAAELLARNAAPVAALLDGLPVPWAITGSSGNGSLLWVNQSFCDVLGWTREEIVSMGWRRLCHPEDFQRTQAAEGGTWSSPVDSFPNRFRCKDGGYRRLRWYAIAYDAGTSLAWVRDDGAAPD